jgi:DNA gyrase/topoisomerase IV subunit B
MNQEWEKLTPYQQVRLRTEWVFGSRDPHTQTVLDYADGARMVETTWVPALFTAFREILDNALDEVVTHGHGDRIDVSYDPVELVFTITDNGRGMPIEWSDEHQGYAATILLSEMMSGRNFGQRGETRGLNGIGAKGVNYCCEWFRVLVRRDKTEFKQDFSEGDELCIAKPHIRRITGKKTGTTISFKLSRQVFADTRLPERFLASRLSEIALCYPDLHLTFNGTRIRGSLPFEEQITFSVDANGFNSQFWLVPNFSTDGDFVFSLVNAIPLFNGGVHVDAFRRHFYTGLLNSLERENRRRKLMPNRADISDGLLIYNVTRMADAAFDSQCKTRLINEPVGTLVRQALDAPEFYKDLIRKHPAWIDAIYSRCAQRTQTQDTKAAIRQAKRNLRQKVEDLEDACGLDRSKCILFLTEGKSAVAGCTEARDPMIHGALPLRGKILNVYGQTHRRILENEALAKIMHAIGLLPGRRANRHSLRYGAVVLACDADTDGANIAALLVNFFYSCWPELFDPRQSPFISVFLTPLLIAVKGKQRRYWYADDVGKFDPDKYKGWSITRAKGLAALERQDWQYALAHPRLQPIVDDGQLGTALDLIFNQSPKAAEQRRAWIGL